MKFSIINKIKISNQNNKNKKIYNSKPNITNKSKVIIHIEILKVLIILTIKSEIKLQIKIEYLKRLN